MISARVDDFREKRTGGDKFKALTTSRADARARLGTAAESKARSRGTGEEPLAVQLFLSRVSDLKGTEDLTRAASAVVEIADLANGTYRALVRCETAGTTRRPHLRRDCAQYN